MPIASNDHGCVLQIRDSTVSTTQPCGDGVDDSSSECQCSGSRLRSLTDATEASGWHKRWQTNQWTRRSMAIIVTNLASRASEWASFIPGPACQEDRMLSMKEIMRAMVLNRLGEWLRPRDRPKPEPGERQLQMCGLYLVDAELPSPRCRSSPVTTSGAELGASPVSMGSKTCALLPGGGSRELQFRRRCRHDCCGQSDGDDFDASIDLIVSKAPILAK
jgi:hypothetical protein